MLRLSAGSSLMISIFLELLGIIGVEMLLPCYTFVFIAVGTVYFLIPRCRKIWWVPPVGFFAGFWISYWVSGLINRLEAFVVPLWLGSAGICMIYGYLIATVFLGLNWLLDLAVKKLQGE